MKLLPAHVDETQARFRLLGPKRDAPAAIGEPAARPAYRAAGADHRGDAQGDTGHARGDPPAAARRTKG